MLVGQLALTSSWTPPYTTGIGQRLKWQSSWCIWRTDPGPIWPCMWWDSKKCALTRSEEEELGWNQNEGIFGNDTLSVCHVPSRVPFPCAGPAGSSKPSSKVASVCSGIWCSSSPTGSAEWWAEQLGLGLSAALQLKHRAADSSSSSQGLPAEKHFK